MPKITMDFYTSVFKDSKVGSVHRFGDDVPGPAGKVMTGTITLCGQEFMVLNGGPNGDQSKFTDAISFMIELETQEEVDYYWEALVADGGSPGRCGWLKDRYGLSWQVVPKALGELMNDPDPVKARAVTAAMLKMDKLDSAGLHAAYDGATKES
jgi:predicted 3-demethylubiquinone-9 3-methyltransferase (glyoxalase superfamily)